MALDLEAKEEQVMFQENMARGLTTILRVYEIERTPLQFFMDNYARVSQFITRDLAEDMKSMSDGHIKYLMFDIMAKKGSVLLK